MTASVGSALELIGQGRHEDGARLFMETVAFGPGSWEQVPGPIRDTWVFNAPVVRDELADPDYTSLELAELAATAIPLQLTCGSETRPAPRKIAEILAKRLPRARLRTIDGAGHVPHITHPRQLAELIQDFWAAAADMAGRPAQLPLPRPARPTSPAEVAGFEITTSPVARRNR